MYRYPNTQSNMQPPLNPNELNGLHGTTTVATKFKGGVVVVADHRASGGTFIMSKTAQKVHKLNEKTVTTISGLVSDAQYIIRLTRAEMRLFELSRNLSITTKMAGNLLASMLHGQFRTGFPFYVHLIVAGIDEEGTHVYFLDHSGSINDEEYASTGSGSLVAYGVLEALFKKEMTEAKAINVTIRALAASMERDAATGNGMDCLIITDDGIRELSNEEIDAELKKE
ncbi:MAG: proteasome subunit beta [Candidatus Heimdallarchaeota archaeon]|nr:proteasome subunit beta [Candidatus Heimdallarchaeota archaeon]MCK5047834.1 proteasome subunit beta [Candidatus Heimdallarchaeota archaeon]